MSTRCQTFIYQGDEKVATIYRHCDGYPSGMGLDLCTILQRCKDMSSFVAAVLTCPMFDAEIEPVDAKHGDTEYEYVVRFPEWGSKAEPELEVRGLWEGKTAKGSAVDVMCKIHNEEWDKE